MRSGEGGLCVRETRQNGVPNLVDAVGLALRIRRGGRIDFVHLCQHIFAPLARRAGVLGVGERAHSHLDVHQARAVDAVRQVGELERDAPLRRARRRRLDRRKVPLHLRRSFVEGVVHPRLRLLGGLEDRSVLRPAEVGDVARDDRLAQLLVCHLDLLPALDRAAALRDLADHPRVLLHVGERHPLLGRFGDQPAEQCDHVLVVVAVVGDRPLLRLRDVLHDLRQRPRVRHVAERHRVQRDPQRPHVRRLRVVLPLADVRPHLGRPYLRRRVRRRAGRAARPDRLLVVARLVEDPRDAKVGEHGARAAVGVLRDQDVVGLEVKVDDPLEVEVLEPNGGVDPPLLAVANLERLDGEVVRVHHRALAHVHHLPRVGTMGRHRIAPPRIAHRELRAENCAPRIARAVVPCRACSPSRRRSRRGGRRCSRGRACA